MSSGERQIGDVPRIPEVLGHDERFLDQHGCSSVVRVLAVVDSHVTEKAGEVQGEALSSLEGDSFFQETDFLVLVSLLVGNALLAKRAPAP